MKHLLITSLLGVNLLLSCFCFGQNTDTQIALLDTILKSEEELVLYPVPTEQKLEIGGEKTGLAVIIDAKGRRLMHAHITSKNRQISVQNLPSGMYRMILTDNMGKKHTASFYR